MTKIHSSDTNKRERVGNLRAVKDKEKTDHIYQEANKVVDLLINDVIDNLDEKEKMIEEVTLDETCVNIDDDGEKKYHNKCEDCDFVVNASNRYIALHQLKTHRDTGCKDKISSLSGSL